MAEASKRNSSRRIFVGLAMAMCCTGIARAESGASDPAAGQASAYVVEGIALGSNIKTDKSAYREYKCSPSDQFGAFTWCQRSRQDRERRGAFEATYSILHSKDDIVVYASRTQQPAFLDAGKAEQDIQNYSRKFGGSPRITKPPHRSGASDAMIATWGTIELEPLDSESVKLLREGTSPRKGLLIDFLGNFVRSAQEGLPIFRIVSGFGFLWAGNFDRKGRGTLRFVAVDASALQRGSIGNAPQSDHPQPRIDREPRRDEQPPQQNQIQPPAAITGTEDATAARGAEATIARLQTELAAAVKEKAEADLARRDAEKAAGTARIDAQTARKELEETRIDANAAKERVEELMKGSGRPASYIKEIIAANILLMIGILVFLTWIILKMRTISSDSKDAERADLYHDLEDNDVKTSTMASPIASSTETETLGVQESIPLSPTGFSDTAFDQPAIEWQEQNNAKTGGDDALSPSMPSGDYDHLISKSIVSDLPKAAEVETPDLNEKIVKPPEPESSATS
jgi:hypothetical protein